MQITVGPTKLGFSCESVRANSKAAKRGGFKRGGFPIWTCPSFFVLFCPFLGLSQFFWDFPDLLGDGPGIFPICPFPLSRPIKSTYEEQSRKGPRHNLDLSRKSGQHPGLETPRFSFSNKLIRANQNYSRSRTVGQLSAWPFFSLVLLRAQGQAWFR